MKTARHLMLAIALAVTTVSAGAQNQLASPPGTSPAELGFSALMDEPSRAELFSEMRANDEANDPNRSKRSQQFALILKFQFPTDVATDFTTGQPRRNSLFGVDISHNQSADFPIETLPGRGVLFLYMKASQGTTFVDDKFSRFWARAGRLPAGHQLHRGAYHFLSAGDPHTDAELWGRKQAETFLKVFRASNPASDPYRATDMPPVMDLEWDRAKSNAPDRWAGRRPEEILKMAKAFLAAVAEGTGRTPVIYTAQSWWHERIGADALVTQLSAYPIWLADYSEKSRSPETPRSINGTSWALWQFTEHARIYQSDVGDFDANIFRGARPEFFRRLGVKEF